MTPRSQAQVAPVHQGEGIKETLESIVVALILAFVFRAFVVEAFVIPTGSMAPTLYGAHGTMLCEDCGVEFGYGVRDLADTRRGVPVLATSKAVCPNCSHPNTSLHVSDDRRNAEKGDRILVLKWPFALGGAGLDPARWDVVVFKDPADGTTNFIKRLVGFPGEVLRIIGGDVFTVPLEALSPEALAELDAIRHEKFEYREGIRVGRLRAVSSEVLDELDEKMVVVRKSAAAQRSLWQPAYDHDYPPHKLDAHQPRWSAHKGDASGWDSSSHRVVFEDRGTIRDYIELTGKEIRAGCAYNIHGGRAPAVSDLRVSFVLTPKTAEGTLRVRLEKLGRRFWASLGMDGLVTLAESKEVPSSDTSIMATIQLERFEPGKSVKISFENLDYRLALTVGGEEVLTSSDDSSSPEYYAADLKQLRRMSTPPLSRPRVYGEGGAFALTHLVVQRDAYYYHNPAFRALALPWAPVSGWASAESPILLRGHEFFMLGDNTAASKDSRLWDRMGAHLKDRGEDFQLGTVPRDQLIGKAFFVYWPSGQRLDWLPIPGLNRWGMIPDVGRMRWIR